MHGFYKEMFNPPRHPHYNNNYYLETTIFNSGGAATAGCRRRPVVVAGPGQGKAGMAGKTGPGQTKPRLGTTGKPAKATSPSRQMALAKNQDQVLACQQHGINMMILTGFGFGFSQFRITYQSHVI